MCTDEIWKPLPVAPTKYSISSLGRLRAEARVVCNKVDHKPRRLKQKILKVPPDRYGYLMGCVYDESLVRIRKPVHIWVATAFIGIRPAGAQVNHKDGDKRNNKVSNLEWVMPAENMRHASLSGLSCRPTSFGERKLSQEMKEDCVRLHSEGMSYHALGRKYGVYHTSIRKLIRKMVKP